MLNSIVSPAELKEITGNSMNSIVICDIRDKNEFIDWNIPGSINIPINSFMAIGDYSEMKSKLSVLPKNKSIITVCTRGINSQVAASILREMKYDAASLEKGMKGWNENFDIYEIDFPGFTVVQFIRIGKGCLSYIIFSKKTRSAILIEPSIFTYEYTNYTEKHKLNLTHILDTHSHADHFSGGMEMSKNLRLNYFINCIDIDNVFDFTSLKDIEQINLDEINIKVIPTPGHTDGSVSFLVENLALFCGDLLLLESPGRPDLARTKEDTLKGAGILFDTLQTHILTMNDSVIIFPSHFTKTNIRPVLMSLGGLKKNNSAILISKKEKFIEYLTQNIPQNPPNYESIKKFNKAGAIIPIDYAEDLEIGPNRCAARN